MLRALRQFIKNNSGFLCIISSLTILYTTYLRYALDENNCDLIYWLDRTGEAFETYLYIKLILLMLLIGVLNYLLYIKFIKKRAPSFRWYDDLTDREIKQYYAHFIFIRLMTEIDRIDRKFQQEQQKLKQQKQQQHQEIQQHGYHHHQQQQQQQQQQKKQQHKYQQKQQDVHQKQQKQKHQFEQLFHYDEIFIYDRNNEDYYRRTHDEMFKAIDEFRKAARKLLAPNEIEITLPIEEIYGIMDDEDRQLRSSRFYQSAIIIDEKLLRAGANVNIYMFFGGTNFGFTAGANVDNGPSYYTSDITSYDYDAVMNECGQVTDKYRLIRRIIGEFFELPDDCPCPNPNPQLSYNEVKMTPIASVLSEIGRRYLKFGLIEQTVQPKTFEELKQHSGLVLYESILPKFRIDPTVITLNGLGDRAYVFIDNYYLGTLSRQFNILSISIQKQFGDKLQILVENQGRVNFKLANDTKGIKSVTFLDEKGNQEELINWTSISMPLHAKDLQNLVKASCSCWKGEFFSDSLRTGPFIFHGNFTIKNLGDTYLNTKGWGKGVAYINGFNIGRYWPLVGPQLSLYVPMEILKKGQNEIILLEYQKFNRVNDTNQGMIQFDYMPQLDSN